MINLPLSDVRIFLCTTAIKMQSSFDSLMGLAQTVFEQDPLSGHLFLFFNRDRNRVKILFWDQDGFCIWYKRLEAGTVQFPEADRETEGIKPNHIYNWQKILFEHAEAAFQESGNRGSGKRSDLDEKIARLEVKLQQKNEVIAELMEENVRTKKSIGEL